MVNSFENQKSGQLLTQNTVVEPSSQKSDNVSSLKSAQKAKELVTQPPHDIISEVKAEDEGDKKSKEEDQLSRADVDYIIPAPSEKSSREEDVKKDISIEPKWEQEKDSPTEEQAPREIIKSDSPD